MDLTERKSAVAGRGPTLAAVLFFVGLNVALYPLKAYFEKQHAANLMQSDHSGAGPTAVPRYDWSVGSEQAKYWSFIPDARRQPVVVLDGMSQIYAINDGRPGDRVTSEILDDSLVASGARAFSIAAPNLNNEEFLFHVHALTQSPATMPTLLVFGVCFDKMRNTEVRPTMQDAMNTNAALDSAWRRSADSLQTQFPELSAQMRRTLAESRDHQTLRLDQRVEQRIVEIASQTVPVVALRTDLRFYLLDRVYMFRNWLFQIKTSTKRPIIADRYTLNQQALIAGVRYARQRGIRVLLYVIPLNRTAEVPYITEQYDQFKLWLEQTARVEGASFANLELAVPDSSWGLLYGQPDFKHFKEAGHLATANALLPLIRAQLSDSAKR